MRQEQEATWRQPKLGVRSVATCCRLQPESDREYAAGGCEQTNGNRFVGPVVHAETPNKLKTTQPCHAHIHANTDNKESQPNDVQVEGHLGHRLVQLRSPPGSALIHVLLREEGSDYPGERPTAEQGGNTQTKSPFGIASHHLGSGNRRRINVGRRTYEFSSYNRISSLVDLHSVTRC